MSHHAIVLPKTKCCVLSTITLVRPVPITYSEKPALRFNQCKYFHKPAAAYLRYPQSAFASVRHHFSTVGGSQLVEEGWETASRRSISSIFPERAVKRKAEAKPLISDLRDTIYALSTPRNQGPIAIVRVSGPSVLAVYEAFCGPDTPPPKPRYATVRTLSVPRGSSTRHPGEIIDTSALVLYFPAPRSNTGEDMLEFHTHGGRATVNKMLSAFSQYDWDRTVRFAEPGEFTKRAFLNNKLDLAQVESLGALLEAETEQQRRAAVRGVAGKRSERYEAWRKSLIGAQAQLEALTDHAEAQDLDETPQEFLASSASEVEKIRDAIYEHQKGSERGELLRKGIKVCLVGQPNAGKSSLMNLILKRDASIVSPLPGTTRDVVEGRMEVGGFSCTFSDTAGLRYKVANSSGSTNIGSRPIDAIEQEGIRRTKSVASQSDVIVLLASVEKDDRVLEGHTIKWAPQAIEVAKREKKRLIIVVNKCEQHSSHVMDALIERFSIQVRQRALENFSEDVPEVADMARIFCLNLHSDDTRREFQEYGINSFVQRLISTFEDMVGTTDDDDGDLLGVTERQKQLLGTCAENLNNYLGFFHSTKDVEESIAFDVAIAAEFLRAAGVTLSKITGRGDCGDVNEILGVVFEKFCIGK